MYKLQGKGAAPLLAGVYTFYGVSKNLKKEIVGQASLPVIDARASLARATFVKEMR
jgi:hypothetical protein